MQMENAYLIISPNQILFSFTFHNYKFHSPQSSEIALLSSALKLDSITAFEIKQMRILQLKVIRVLFEK